MVSDFITSTTVFTIIPVRKENDFVSTAGKQKSLDDVLQEFSQHRLLMQEELQKIIVGQDEVIEQLFAAIFTRGHCLLEGVPGLAKTLMVSTVARILDVDFKRVQFTPDLMPSDITGTNVLDEDESGRRNFRFVEGPIFTNVLLADEINRTPPKTQAALLQAMQEREVSVGQETYQLPDPFFTIATQNPVEQEGTYPLPEAQLDRFLYKIMVDYPVRDEEIQIVKQISADKVDKPKPVMSREQVLAAQEVVRRVVVSDAVVGYATDLIRATRIRQESSPDFVRETISWGAGPRASINLVIAAKVRAAINGRYHVSVDDIKAVVHPILRHRIITNFTAQAKGLSSDDIITQIVEATPEPGQA